MKKAATTAAKKRPATKAVPKTPAGECARTIEAAAAAVPVNERTLKRWFALGCPKTPGRYDVGAICAWRDANLKPRKGAAPERSKWEARKARADAKLKELELRNRRGEMILVKRAAQVVGQAIAAVVTHLDQLPEFAVASERLPTEVKRKLREKLRIKIQEMKSTLERSIREMAATARRDKRRIGTNEPEPI